VTAYCVVSESLANIGKHAHASKVTVAVTQSGSDIVVAVTDDGVGAPTANGDRICTDWPMGSNRSVVTLRYRPTRWRISDRSEDSLPELAGGSRGRFRPHIG
jgi:hypothetical protein